MFICFFSRIYRAYKDQNLMGDNCVNMTRLSQRGWSSKLGAFVSSIQAVDSQHRCGSSDNARQMLSMAESKRDTSPSATQTAVWLMIVTTCDFFLSLTFNRIFCWICLFFLKWCFSYELLFFWNYLAPKHFLIDLFLKWVIFIVIFHYHSSIVNFCLELFLIFVKVT